MFTIAFPSRIAELPIQPAGAGSQPFHGSRVRPPPQTEQTPRSQTKQLPDDRLNRRISKHHNHTNPLPTNHHHANLQIHLARHPPSVPMPQTVCAANTDDPTVPTNLTTWDFLFTSSHSPLSRTAPPAAFRNALTSERLNWAQVRDLATRISTALVTRYGLQPGDTVALFSQNTVWYPVAMFACLRVGARISGASPAYNADEMAYALKTAGAKILMTEEKALGVADEAVKKAGMGGSVFLLEGAREGYLGIKELVRMGEQATSQVEAYKIPEGKTNADICGYLSFSSGTTGLPKAVMISHGNVIAQCLQVQFSAPPESRTALAVLPLFHSKLLSQGGGCS